MRRLWTVPRAFVFVRSSLDGTVHDFTNDIVSYNVDRVVNDYSTASFTVRNVNFRYGANDYQGHTANLGRPQFAPNDLCTIFLQRYAGKPVQVFTGYLDGVPYYQGYPGLATFNASCTLKKLAYTYFDPGLPAFRNWLQSNGWIMSSTSGDYLNPSQYPSATGATSNDPDTFANISDTSFAKLLYDFMTGPMGWDPSEVLISDLPSDLGHVASTLFKAVNDSSAADVTALGTWLQQNMGVTVTQNADGTNSQGTLDTVTTNIVKAITRNTAGIPPIVLVSAALIFSSFSPATTPQNTVPDYLSPNTGGYGIYNLFYKDSGNSYLSSTIGGVSVSDLTDVGQSTAAFASLLNSSAEQAAGVFYGYANLSLVSTAARKQQTQNFINSCSNNNTEAIQAWIETASNRTIEDPNQMSAAVITAKRYITALTNPSKVASTASVAVQTTTEPLSKLGWTDAALNELLTTDEQQTIQTHYQGSHNTELVPYLYTAKKQSSDIYLVWDKAVSSSQIRLTYAPTYTGSQTGGKGNPLWDFLAQFTNQKSSPEIHLNNPGGGAYVSILQGNYQPDNLIGQPLGSISVYAAAGSTLPAYLNVSVPVSNVQTKAADTGSQSPSATNGLTISQLGQFSANAAFAEQFAFPTNLIKDELMTGDKALMNVVSGLDGIKQFAQASMRDFQSLPDGRFLGFYPDYFGARGRTAYWSVSNIEIVDFNIQLNDYSLATHVFIVGDTMTFGQGDSDTSDLINAIASRGVATLSNPGILNTFLNVGGSDAEKALDAAGMLQHYGARIYEEDNPLIRNATYEFLLAYQRFIQKWASQFETTVELTFQPEIMVGGLVEFPDHGLQVYVKEVSHGGDYTSGFTTSVTITAPSIIPSLRSQFAGLYPGFALGGAITSVGNGGD